jgi:hypothetical protein
MDIDSEADRYKLMGPWVVGEINTVYRKPMATKLSDQCIAVHLAPSQGWDFYLSHTKKLGPLNLHLKSQKLCTMRLPQIEPQLDTICYRPATP